MAGTRSQYAVHLSAAPRLVWDRLQLAATWETLGPVNRVWDAAHDAEGVLRSYRWSATVGPQRIEGTATTRTAQPPEAFELELDASGITGVLSTHLAANRSGTLLTVGLQLRPTAWLSTAFFPFVSRAITDGLPAQVEDFAAGFG